MTTLLNRIAFTFGMLALAACATPTPSPAKVSTHEIVGTQAERIVAITKVLTGNGARPLPSPLLDAHLVEVQHGDGQLGPSDFTSFIALDVDAKDVAAWRSVSVALTPPPSYAAPDKVPTWWVGEAAFAKLSFYAVSWFTSRQGWMGVSGDGHVYLMTFTM